MNTTNHPIATDYETMIANLPALTGTDKQVAWATALRLSTLETLAVSVARNGHNPKIMAALVETAMTRTEAKYWIDTRFAQSKIWARISAV